MRKLKCSNPKCGRVWAHVLGNKTLDIARQKHQITITGDNVNVIGTCGFCNSKTAVFVEDGKLVEEGLEFVDGERLDEDEKKRLEDEALKQRENQEETENNALDTENKPAEDDTPAADDEQSIDLKLIAKKTPAVTK